MEATKATTSENGHAPQSPEAVSFRPGNIIGAYKILSLIGKGGMGEVFKVEHTLTKRIEAIKTLSADHSQEAERFLREVQIHASLSHPNIASVHNAFWAGEDLVMAMEFVEGQSLRKILERGRIALATAIDYVCQALSALAYAHAHHVTHRDITPGNMLVTSSGRIKLTDFGLAKLPTDLRLTKTGMMVGSLYYMSPEQVRAVPDVDQRSDLYSVGAVLYEMITGARPFDGDSAFAIMLAQVGQDPPAPISLEPTLPVGLNELILKALAKDPGDRFQSALEFRQALESFRDREKESLTGQRLCSTGELQISGDVEQNSEDCRSVERIIDKPANQTERNFKRLQELAKKVIKDFFRLPGSANSWNWTFQLSESGQQPGIRWWVNQRVEVLPALTIHPEPRTPKWRWFALAASVLAVVGSVFAAKTWQRIQFIPPMSPPVRAQMTIPVAMSEPVALRNIFLQPLMTTLTLNMSAGNAALNDNPVPMQDGVSTQTLAPGNHSLYLTRNGGKATIQFRIRAGAMPEVTNVNAGNIAITAVALFGKEARVHRSGESNAIRITDLSPGLQMIGTGNGAGQFEVRIGDAPSLQVFVTDPKTVDLIVTSNEDDATVLIRGARSGVIRHGKYVASLSPGGYTIEVKKPGFTNPSKEKVRLVMGKPQTINFALVRTVASLAVVDTPETQVLVDGNRTTGVVDVSSETEKNLQPGKKPTAPVAGRIASDSPDSETVATVSFEPIAPSRLNTILKLMSPARVVHPHEKVGFVPAKPIHEATPRVPLRLMRGARAQVSANVRVIIDRNGKVTGVNREPATEKGPLPDAAMAAAWNWTFKPARKGSNPVESQAILHFLFQNPEFASANR